MIIVLVLLGLVAIYAVMLMLFPRQMYWKTQAWAVRNPHAHEPSDAGYRAQQIGAALALGAIVWIVWILWDYL